MNQIRSVAVVAVAEAFCLGAMRTLVAQEGPSPEHIVASIQSAGTIAPVLSHVGFHGCPQEDDHGRAVLEAISRATLPTNALWELSMRWRDAFRDCDYAPLQSWFEQALLRLTTSTDATSAFQFLSSLPPDIPDGMRETLLQAAGGSHPMFVRGSYASASVRGTKGSDWVARAIAAFRDRALPSHWIQDESGVLLREHPDLFIPALARAAPGFSDDRITAALSMLAAALSRGRIDQSTPGMDALRAAVRARDGIPEHIRDAIEPR